MWKNFIRVTFRSLRKNLSIVSETSYDRFHTRSADMYRLYLHGKMAGEEFKGAWNSPIFGPTFHEEIPDIENFCRFHSESNLLVWATPDNKYLENSLLYADSTFFEIFSIKLLEGDPATCLDEPNGILLSESKVKQFFPDGEAMGKSLSLNDEENLYTVTGIVEDAPRTSHFFYDFIASYCTLERSRRTGWFNNHM